MKTKVVIFTIIVALLLTVIGFTVSAYGGFIIPSGELLTDRGDVIPDADEDEIIEAIAEAESGLDTKIRVFAYRGTSYYDYLDYIDESEESFYSLVLLVIQYDDYSDEYYYYLDTYGDAHYSIKDKEVDRILDNNEVYDNIKSGNLREGIIAFATLAKKASAEDLRPDFVKVLIISLVIAVIVAFIVCLSIYLAYKKKLHAESYPLNRFASLDLKIERDSFVTKFITRVRINTSNDGSSRSGGGRSGGGGGRRGGR